MVDLFKYSYGILISIALITLPNSVSASFSDLEELTTESYPYTKIVKVGLFSGKDPVSKLIGAGTRSDITHVCAVVEQEDGELLCYESMPHSGVRLMSWEKRVAGYAGSVFVADITYDEGEEPSEKALTESIKTHLGKKYQGAKSLFSMVKAISKSNEDEDESDLERLFCSELLALTFEDLGLLAKGITKEDYVPADFAKAMTLRNATLGTPELIKEYESGGALGCLKAFYPKTIYNNFKMALASLKGIS